jgi:hypothetical protein
MLYVPLTEHDYTIRRDPRYRVGRRLGSAEVALACLFTVGLPASLIATAVSHEPISGSAAAYAVLAVMFVTGICTVYSRLFYARQDKNERRRAYPFWADRDDRDPQVRRAVDVLYTLTSSDTQRQDAIDDLVRLGRAAPPRAAQ